VLLLLSLLLLLLLLLLFAGAQLRRRSPAAVAADNGFVLLHFLDLLGVLGAAGICVRVAGQQARTMA
jgi:hypothetical protein